MFDNISLLPDDPIFKLSALYKKDQRANKIDAGVGVFQNAKGLTPIMKAVKQAEQQIWQEEDSKSYLSIRGNDEFNQAITKLVLGDDFDQNRTRTIQAIAGTGALRLIGETIRNLLPNATLWLPDPTWGNHQPIFKQAGLNLKTYPYYDLTNASFKRDEFFNQINQLGNKDIVLLHGCCHNPTGEDLTSSDWDKLAQMALSQGFLPVIDLAYLGFGQDIEQDSYGVRLLAKKLPYLLIANSCSKNFGLYRDRIGAVIAIAPNSEKADALSSQITSQSRAMISMPADHGAKIVAKILNNQQLKLDWHNELQEMCQFINQQRQKLQQALTNQSDDDWSCVTRHKGMFTLLPLGKELVSKLQQNYAIYIVGTGRINLAGLNSDEKIAYFAQSVIDAKKIS